MSNTIYLYLKTHNKTGLKYLGKTVQDPHEYRGSGLVWNRHLDKHGDDVTTEILFETNNIDEFKQVALKYSDKWNIVESKKFANLMVEQGDGGDTSHLIDYEKFKHKQMGENNHFHGKTHTPEAIAKIKEARAKQVFSGETRKLWSEQRKGRVVSEKTREKISKALKGREITWAKPHTDEHKKYMSELRKSHNPGFVKKAVCPHCGKEGQYAGMKRWHFDDCKEKK